MKSLFAFFVERPLLVNLCMFFILALGVASLNTAVVSAYPDFRFGAFSIITKSPGRSPQDVELGITAPLEEELLKVDGIKILKSTSVEGFSAITIAARDEVSNEEIEELGRDLQRAIDRAGTRLPPQLPEKPLLTELSPKLEPTVELLVAGHVSEQLLREASNRVVDELREIDGVSGIDKRSYREREVRILLNPLVMHQLGISYQEIESAIRSRNITRTGGALESYVAEKNVIAVGRFAHPKEVENVIIRAPDHGNYVRIKDIAEVVMDYEDWSVRAYVNGLPGTYIGVRKESDANELRVVKRVRSLVAELNTRLPPGIEVKVANDLSRFTGAMLNSLWQNGVAGMFLVFGVLLLFFPWRSAFWVMAGMPLAVMLGFAMMPLAGLTVNQFTLGSVILMLGLLVDDAIVTSESIFRHFESGLPPRQAAIEGTTAIAPPVITGAITTLLAFCPLLFLGGKEGKFMWMMPAMVMLIIAASLLECKFILPSHIAESLRKRLNFGPKASWFGQLEIRYRRLISSLLQHRYLSLLVLTLAFTGIMGVGLRLINVDLYPDSDVDVIHLRAKLPPGSSFDHSYRQLRQVEQHLHQIIDPRDLQNTRLTVGSHDIGRPDEVHPGNQSAWGMIDIFLEPLGVRQSNALELSQRLRLELTGFSQFDSITLQPKTQGPPIGYPVEVHVISNTDERGEVAEDILGWLRQHPAVSESWTNYDAGKDIVNLQLNHEAIADHGLNVADITRSIRVAFDGYIVDELQTLDERVRYRLQFQPPHQGNPATLRSLTLVNRDGDRIPLRAVVDFEIRPGQASINHYFGKRVETVYGIIDRNQTSVATINTELSEFISELKLDQQYPGLRIRQVGELSSQQATLRNMSSALGVIVVAIYLVMALLFNSLSQPLIVLLQIPLGFAGVLVAFLAHGYDLSVPAMMGFLGLVGVMVNGAIVLIDRLNQYRQENGLVSAGDIAEGASYRLRPILITSLTTVAGLAPAAYGLMGSNPFLTPMIMAMLWGIAFSTVITLLYVPCLYAVEQDLQQRLGCLSGSLERAGH